MILSAIVAVSDNGVIGKGNKLPWHLPADLKRFRELTMGHTVIMGRKCYQSIGKPLEGRVNIVLTRDEGFQAPGCIVARDLGYAIEMARAGVCLECFFIGGAEVYKQALPMCERLYVTNVRGVFDGDAFLPPLCSGWSLVREEYHEADEKNGYAHRFSIFERI